MNKIAIAGIIAGALITAAAVDTLRQARNQLRSIKLLNKQVEEDHSQLVKLYLQTRRKVLEATARLAAAAKIADEQSGAVK